MSLKKNDEIVLKIEDMTNEGSSVGHYDGQAVFVSGGVTGDELCAHIIKAPSPDRISSDCPYSDKCGGCSFRNMTYSSELEYKQRRVENALKRIGNIDAPVREIVKADEINHYRNKAQYPVDIQNGELVAGFYAYKSHRIVPCNSCLLQPEEFSLCIDAFSKWAKESGVTSYDEKTGKGLLRHIYLRKAVATGEIMACAVINGNSLPNENLLVELLSRIDGVCSVCVNINKNDTNVILGDQTKIIYGKEFITDILLGKKFVISPNSFYQVNHNQCEKLYSIAGRYADLTGNETVVDLYCGAGTIGLSMADKIKTLYGVEIIPQAIENAKLNAEINGINNAEFFCADAFETAKILENKGIKPDVLILDPPRKGCQSELFDVVEKMSPKRIVYVSCDSATLARDLNILEQKGFKTVEATPVDMFPRTPHVETVVQLVRKKPDTYIDITVDMDELDLTSSEAKATYEEIKDYIFDKHRVKVSSLYIAQVKQKHGIIERDCYNNSKKENPNQPQCPPEKVKLIEEALRYFKMIPYRMA